MVPYFSSIQVSLVPPPWEDLTTSEPALSATRVSPPGVMSIPYGLTSTKGRRSTWRGASPARVRIGTQAVAFQGDDAEDEGDEIS